MGPSGGCWNPHLSPPITHERWVEKSHGEDLQERRALVPTPLAVWGTLGSPFGDTVVEW